MDDWKPIETAPRDGSQFLAYDPVANDFAVCVMSDWIMPWRCRACQMDSEYGPDDDEFKDNRATHWMPLPKPPAL